MAAALLLSCCGGPPAPGPPALPRDVPSPGSPYREPLGELLAFGSQEGRFRNYFFRRGVVAGHVLTRSGHEPRLIVAFPANNQGIGLWFHANGPAELWAGERATTDEALQGVIREDARRAMAGIRTILRSDARSLNVSLAVLAGVRTLRDYGYGACLEDAASYPELRDEVIAFLPAQNAVRVRREQLGGENALELLLVGRGGTRLSLGPGELPKRPACPAARRDARSVTIENPQGAGLEVELVALSDEAPLTPVPPADVFAGTPPSGREADALAFLSYEEKLLAGSWRFLTYFGRDTLLALRLLMPALRPDFAEAALGSAIERVNLDASRIDTELGPVELGDVAHEEEVGDFAAYRNLKESRRELRAPRYDYKMVDDDFLLAPVLVDAFALSAGDTSRHEAFLGRARADGRSYRDAILANLELVLSRARPFADDPSRPAQKRQKLVALKLGTNVGQWRDSESGIAFGRYAFDVNVALVPAALTAAIALYRVLGNDERVRESQRLLRAWRGVDALFRVELPIGTARRHVADYARAVGVVDASAALQAEPDGRLRYDGVALDAQGVALPVLHSDHGFAMEFTSPSDDYLRRAAAALCGRFPAGLASDAGLMVASPALAPPGFVTAGVERAPLRDLFSRSEYHGTVVWSWQQALVADGLRRQLARSDIAPNTRAVLESCECLVWRGIRNEAVARTGELWSWEPGPSGSVRARAFGDVRADVDESNAIQLWSTVYLAVKAPARCAGD